MLVTSANQSSAASGHRRRDTAGGHLVVLVAHGVGHV